MSKCDPQDPHSWQLLYVVKDTRPFPEAVWGCACGSMKKVSHHLAGYRLHPDERLAHMKARAEATQENEDEE